MTIGKRISTLRQERKLSQEYLAEQMGVTRQAVSKWENDQTAPDTNNLVALAEFFEVSIDYLATGRKEDEKPEPFELGNLVALSVCLFLAPFILRYVGNAMGVYKIYVGFWPGPAYDDSPLAIILMVMEALCIIAAVGLLIAYRVLKNKRK